MISHVTRRAVSAVIVGTLLTAAPFASSESLLDIYEIALDNDAQLKAETAQYRADLELKTLALAPLLPQVRTGVSRSIRDSENTRLSITDFENGQVVIQNQTSGSRTETTSYDINCRRHYLTCPLGSIGKQATRGANKLRRLWLLPNKI